MNKVQEQLETPALLLDKLQLLNNIDNIANMASTYGVDYRPHIKTHKSKDIASLQINSGAIGLTAAKVGEAEMLVEAGFKDVLIAYPISHPLKIKRIQKLREQARIVVAVDSFEQASRLNQAMEAEDPLEVWIKVNSGLNRCGVEPREEVLELAADIGNMSGLSLTGLLTHAGHAYGAGSISEVKQIAKQEVTSITESAQLCEDNGIPIKHRSVGSTPTFQFYENMEEITEIRPGNAVFFDMVQVGLGAAAKEQCALTVKASVVTAKHNRIVIDAGSKTLALDKGAHGNDSIQGHGYIMEHPNLVIGSLSEEHGIIPVAGDEGIQVGDVLTIIPNHACVVANLFDNYLLHQQDEVLDTWEVTARGRKKITEQRDAKH
ncbi:MAG TPA: alanine racemase [Pseudogracilibacillus sp.]|nr:alanine racemase [Pseudogracilibacillus sp.]